MARTWARCSLANMTGCAAVSTASAACIRLPIRVGAFSSCGWMDGGLLVVAIDSNIGKRQWLCAWGRRRSWPRRADVRSIWRLVLVQMRNPTCKDGSGTARCVIIAMQLGAGDAASPVSFGMEDGQANGEAKSKGKPAGQSVVVQRMRAAVGRVAGHRRTAARWLQVAGAAGRRLLGRRRIEALVQLLCICCATSRETKTSPSL